MTNFTFLTNLFGQRSEKTTRQSGHTLESIVSRFSLVSLICTCMLTLGVGNVLGASVTYQHVFNAKPSTGNNITLSSVSWDITATNLGSYNGTNYAGVQFGAGGKNPKVGDITLTSSSTWGSSGTYNGKTKITEIRVWLNQGGNSVTASVTIGGNSVSGSGSVTKNSTAGSDWTQTSCITFTPTSSNNSGVVVITATTGSNTIAGYICCIEIDCEEPGGGTPTCATPTFSPAADSYCGSQSVELSCDTEGATIYYTTDGSTPTTSSSVYSSAITVSSSQTIKALATKTGMNNSSVGEAAYTINTPLTTMDAIFAAATSAGSEATDVCVTFNNWVVSDVSTNGKNVYVTDGTKGFIIFNNGAGMGFSKRNILSGTVSCKVQLYHGAPELTNLTSSTTGLSVTTGGTVTPVEVDDTDISNLSGVNTGSVVTTTGTCTLTDGNYYISGAQIYNQLLDPYTPPTSGLTYTITGVFVLYNSTHEILPQSIVLASSCTVDPTIGDPTIPSSFTLTSLTEAVSVNGSVGAGSGCVWTDMGLVWGTTANPTTSDNKKVIDSGTPGNTTSFANNVQPSGSTTPTAWAVGTTYYVRIYGKNGKDGATYNYSTNDASFTLRSIDFEENGGSTVNMIYCNSGGVATKPADPTKDGYSFGGWYKEAGLSNAVDWANDVISANKTYYAKWTALAPCTVTLKDNDTQLTQAAWGTSIYLPERAGCEGSFFAGWTKTWVAEQSSWTTTAPTIIPAGEYTPSSNENLYPVYTKTETGSGTSTVDIEYPGGSSTNMTGNNDAAALGLDADEWSVIATKGGNNNFPGLNTAGDIRLYYHAEGGNTITITAPQTITSVELTFTGNDYSNAWIKVGGENVTPSDGVYAINATSFVIGNANTSNAQVRIKKITVTFTASITTTSYISVPECTIFGPGRTIFIQAGKDGSAWDANSCVKAWFNNSGAGGSAQPTYWLFDATDGDAGKKLFATIIPASGDVNQVTLQRFASNCTDFWNNNGTLTGASASSNTFRTECSGNDCVAWNATGVIMSLKGSIDSWSSSLGTFIDQGNGVWMATYNNYTPVGTSANFKIETNYNGWIGNKVDGDHQNEDATLNDMIVGSTYNVIATLDVTDHSLVITKEFVKGTVHFDLQGLGSSIASLTNVTAGSKIVAPTAPTASGYLFRGWYKEAGCINEWDFDNDVMTETMTLYAKWVSDKFTVTWVVNGETSSTTNNVANGSTTPAPASPSIGSTSGCDGTKVFIGWTAISDYDHATEKPNDLFTTTSPAITDDITFYAVFAMANGTKTYEFEITKDYFVGSSYADNDNEKTSVATATDGTGVQMEVKWTSHDVMQYSGAMQWRKKEGAQGGFIYNSTDLGTVNSVTVTAAAGSFETFYGSSQNPSSGAQGANKGYFTTKVGNATGTVSSVVVNFSAPYYVGYATTCVASTKCITPIFDPGAGTYSSTQSVHILSTAGATIYYTTDGTDPASSGTRQTYSSAISVSANTTIKAIAVKDGLTNSDVATATYNIRCAAPTFSPTPGTYLSFQQVALSCATSEATIYFTLDGSDPSDPENIGKLLEYAEAIDVHETTVIKAIAVKTGMTESEVAIGKYIIADCDWYESFASCAGSGGNDDRWTGVSGSGGIHTDHDGWTITNGGYGGNQCIKAGTGDKNGYVTTPTISVTSGIEYKLTFEIAPWDNGTPMFELTNAVISGGSNKKWTAPGNMTALEWNKYEVYITTAADKDNITIKFFSTGKRFWLNDVCLKAIGDVKYHVTYDGNGETGGSVPTDATNYNRNATATVLGNTGSLVKTGYSFVGWNTAADGSGTDYTAGNTFSISQDVTLYAQWTIETYTIAWQVNGSPASGGATSATYGTQPASIPTAPTSGNCDGSKVFIGWSATAISGETPTRPKDLFTSKYAAPYITANTTFYAVFATPPAASTQFDLYSGALTEGEYLVTYNNKAMKAAVMTNRLNYETVTPADDKISTNEPTLVWYLYQDGGYWRIYNTTAGYVAATKVKNQAVIILDGSDNKAKWTATGSTTYEFENKDRAESASNPDNKWLRENGTYGFACYATGTGNALTLYKRHAAYTNYSTTCAVADRPYLIADPTMLDFGNVAVNASVPAQTITLSGANLGNTTISITAPAGFTISPTSIPVNGELTATTITVTPITTAAIQVNDNLTITYTDPITPANSITINIPLILKVSPLYTVTLHDLNTEDGNPQVSTLTQATPGSDVILPTTSPSTICMINGWVFAGWVEGSAQSETSDKPTLHLAEAYTPAANVDLYAVYMDRTACTTHTDNITRSTTTAEDNDTYTEWKDKQAANVGHSDAVYAGSTAGGNNAIQFRSTDESGLITTTPGATGGVVSRVSVTWNAATVTGRVLQVYGKNTPYGTTSELYDPENRGILLGTLTKGTNITTDVLTIDADFEYIGIRSKEDLAYATTISIEWSNSCTRKWNSNPACNPCTAKPTVNAAIVESFATTSATVNCSGITDITGEGGTGGCVITSYGYCWGISETPNLTDNFHEMGKTYTTLNNAFGEYTITGLTPGVKYCVRPYATNGLGTAYGAAECFTTTLVDHISFGVPNGVDAPQSVTLDVALPYADVPEDCGNCWVFVGWTLEDTWDAHVLPSPLYKPGYSATSQGLSGTHKLYAVYKRDFYRMLTYPSELLLDQDTTEFDDNYYVLTLYTGEETGEWAMDAALSGNYATTKNIDDILHLEYGNYSIFNPQPENIWHLEGLTKSGSGEGSTAATKIYNLVEGSSKKYIRLASSGAVITTNGSDGNLNFSITSNNEAGLAASFNIYRKGSGGGGYWGGGGSTYYLARMTFNNGKPGYTCSTSTPQYSAYIYKRKNLEYKTIPECPKYTVTWKLNGATVRTDYVSRCEGVPKPPTPPVVSPLDECGANGFLGWSTHKLGHLGSEYAPSDVFQYKEDAPELMGNVTFYAIYGYAAGYEYVGDKSVLTHGETYLLVNRKTQGAGKAIDASNLLPHDGSTITAQGGTVQVGAGAIIEGEYEDLEFYCDQRKAYSSNLRVASDASRTKYLYISDKGIGYKVNSASSHYTTKNLLYGWVNGNSNNSARYAYWNNTTFTVSNYNKNVYAFRKLYKNFKTTCYEEWPATAVEWGQNKLIIDMDTTASVVATAAKYDVQIGSLHTSKMNVVQTKTSYNGYPSPRTFTIDGSSKFNFTTNAGDVLIVNWYDASNEKIAFSHIYIPSLVASNTTLTENKDELHVLPGAMLTVNAAHEIGQLEIYPGATVFITGATLKAEKFILRGGWNRINSKDSAMYDVGRVDIHPSGSLQKSHAFMDWYLDYDLYYPIAVPFLVATNDIVFKNEKFSAETTRSVIKMKYYDGKQRAETNQTKIGENWKDYSQLPTNLEPSKGYAFTAKRPSGRAFSIIRMPMSFTNAWTTNGEKGVVGGSQKNVVEITKYEYAGTIWKAMGWNFVANPYLALYNGKYLTGNLQIQYGGEVRYATIPKPDFQDYYQVDITKADLKPGSGFFVQAGGSAGQKQNIIFASDGRKHMPARTMRGTMDDQEVFIRLSHADTNDQMGIIVGEDYTEEYEINADLVKFMSTNDNSLKSYLRYPIPTGDSIDIMDMAYVALNPELAKEWIPVIVRVPAAGEYTYSLKESSKVSALEAVWLLDGLTGLKTNLLIDEYTFHAAEPGTISGRFSINAIVRGEETPTGVGYLSDDDDKCVKFILNDHIYLRCNGMIYDMTGKTVELPIE